MSSPSESHSLVFIVIPLLIVVYIGNLLHNVYYNLHRHPLAHIPGPKLAAATYLYQTYYSLVGGSRYYIEIAAMHKKYGPVVRVTPDEIHLSDPTNYEIINNVGSKYAKSLPFYDALSVGYSTFSAGPADVHRMRRGMLNPFFSRQMVMKMESLVQMRADKLCQLVRTKFAKNEPVDLHHAFRAISVDVITDYAFGQSYNLLDTDDLGAELFAMIQGVGPAMWIFQQWPEMRKFALSLPRSVAKAMSRPLGRVMRMQDHCLKQVLAVQTEMKSGRKAATPSIFEVLLSPHDEYIIPTPDQIKDEAYSILAAAADTTGNAMTVAAYHVVNNPEIYKRLSAELEEAFPDPEAKLSFAVLEKLPYLTGVIKEGLRLSFGVPGRAPRVVPQPGATFNDIEVPGGTFVSMSSWVLHQDESYFPNAQTFDPTRWLDPKTVRHMETAFVPFSKGTRGCVGMPLAYSEMYLSLGTLFRQFPNLKSNVLTKDDLVYDDYFSAYHPFSATLFHVVP